ncbi:MAG: DUF3641 domain-containing protein [Candidatus Manganitrophus sp.]|nr:DUF3641 domain-containing protein [Candidatus Manganitrophus sp.]
MASRSIISTRSPTCRSAGSWRFLIETGNVDGYMERLANAFNPAAAAGVMCRDTISVGWDGTLYDCDFNQMLDLPVDGGLPRPAISPISTRPPFTIAGLSPETIATAAPQEPAPPAAAR